MFKKYYFKAFWIGCILSIFQQLSGINAVVFYSNELFRGNAEGDEGDKQARLGTLLFGTVNMLTALSSTFLLKMFGRKILLVVGQFSMSIALGLFALFAWLDLSGTLQIIMVLIYTAFFEFSIGPILWLYLAEILPPAGLGIAVFLNWAVVIMISFLTPLMIPWSKVITFLLYCIFCFVGGIFILFFVRETKGKSKEQLKILYAD